METPPKTVAQKLRENLAALREQGAPRERIDEEIARAKTAMDAQSKAERKLSGVEKVAAVGSKLGSGATFGLLDEAVGLFDEDAKNEQRFLQKQLEEENPGVALAAEVAGGFAMPGAFLKAPGQLAVGATKLARAGRAAKVAGTVLGEGAIQGGLSGVGNAEGSLEDRIGAGASGAAWGAGLAGGISGVGRGIQGARKVAAMKRGVHTPSLDELVNRMPDDDLRLANENFNRISSRGLGDEARMADVLPQGEGALRAQRTASKGTAKTIDAELRDRSTRLANMADDRLSQHTGTQRQSARRSVEEITEEARARARPHYEAAEREAADYELSPETFEGEIGTTNDKLQRAVELPYVKNEVQRLTAGRAKYAGTAADDPRLLDQAYKNIGAKIRELRKINGRTPDQTDMLDDLISQRGELADAITSRAPSYRKALDEYADEMSLKDAYETGATKNTPADLIPSEMRGLSGSEQKMYREGKVQNLRANVPNADLGEFARFSDVMAPVANREKAEVFKATFGDKAYREYLADLVEMAKMQRMRAGGGESTTIDKLIEQMQANPDLLEAAGELAKGNLLGAAKRTMLGVGMDNLLSSQRNADINARFLMRKGNEIPRTLDEMVRVRGVARQPQRPVRLQRGSDWSPSLDLVKDASAREAGAIAGRSRREKP